MTHLIISKISQTHVRSGIADDVITNDSCHLYDMVTKKDQRTRY